MWKFTTLRLNYLFQSKDFRTTKIAVGVAEHVTCSYYFFLLELDHTKRLVQPLIARSLSSDETLSTYSPERLSTMRSLVVFNESIKRVMKGVHVDVKFLAHDCSRACANIPGNMMKYLCRYQSEKRAIEEIQMDESGVILEGWGGS